MSENKNNLYKNKEKHREEALNMIAQAFCDELSRDEELAMISGYIEGRVNSEFELEKLQESNRILKEALEYYANGNGGDEEEDSSFMPATLDFPFSGTQLGKCAREALEKVGEL